MGLRDQVRREEPAMPDGIKPLVRRFYEEMSAGRLEVIDELLADDFVDHEELPGDLPQDRQGVKQFFTMLRAAFPDMRMDVEDLIAASSTGWR